MKLKTWCNLGKREISLRDSGKLIHYHLRKLPPKNSNQGGCLDKEFFILKHGKNTFRYEGKKESNMYVPATHIRGSSLASRGRARLGGKQLHPVLPTASINSLHLAFFGLSNQGWGWWSLWGGCEGPQIGRGLWPQRGRRHRLCKASLAAAIGRRKNCLFNDQIDH